MVFVLLASARVRGTWYRVSTPLERSSISDILFQVKYVKTDIGLSRYEWYMSQYLPETSSKNIIQHIVYMIT